MAVLYTTWKHRTGTNFVGTNEQTTPPLCLTGMIPFETAGRKLDDDKSGRGGDRAS